MRSSRGLVVALLLVLACNDRLGTAPSPEIQGHWSLMEYVDTGVIGVTTGDMSFYSDGSFETLATVTFPGEPEDSLTTSGTWSQDGATVSLTAEGVTSDWQITGSSTQVTLRLMGQTPPTWIVLQRVAR